MRIVEFYDPRYSIAGERNLHSMEFTAIRRIIYALAVLNP